MFRGNYVRLLPMFLHSLKRFILRGNKKIRRNLSVLYTVIQLEISRRNLLIVKSKADNTVFYI